MTCIFHHSHHKCQKSDYECPWKKVMQTSSLEYKIKLKEYVNSLKKRSKPSGRHFDELCVEAFKYTRGVYPFDFITLVNALLAPECHKFINLPGIEIIESHEFINHPLTVPGNWSLSSECRIFPSEEKLSLESALLNEHTAIVSDLSQLVKWKDYSLRELIPDEFVNGNLLYYKDTEDIELEDVEGVQIFMSKVGYGTDVHYDGLNCLTINKTLNASKIWYFFPPTFAEGNIISIFNEIEFISDKAFKFIVRECGGNYVTIESHQSIQFPSNYWHRTVTKSLNNPELQYAIAVSTFYFTRLHLQAIYDTWNAVRCDSNEQYESVKIGLLTRVLNNMCRDLPHSHDYLFALCQWKTLLQDRLNLHALESHSGDKRKRKDVSTASKRQKIILADLCKRCLTD